MDFIFSTSFVLLKLLQKLAFNSKKLEDIEFSSVTSGFYWYYIMYSNLNVYVTDKVDLFYFSQVIKMYSFVYDSGYSLEHHVYAGKLLLPI